MGNEQKLLSAINQGDRTAMKQLYERYKGYAMSIGLRYIPEVDNVEDVVQDSFITILTSIGKFDYRGEGSLKGWIGRIVANKAIDFVKKNERITFVDTIPDKQEDEPEIERIPPDELTAMIARLPSGCRMILNLYVFEHYSHKEIANQLGIKENTSSSQLSRARQLLTKMMTDYIKRHET